MSHQFKTHFQKHHHSKGDLHSSHMKQCFASTVFGNTSMMCGKRVFQVKHAHAKLYLCVLYLSKCRRRGFTNNLWAGFWITWSCTAEQDFRKHNLPILLDGKACLELGHVMMHWNRETSSHALQYKQNKSSQSIQLPAHSSAVKNPRSASVLMGFPASGCGNI